MNATSPNETDELDRLFSDFFKSQLKQPWPKAPVPAGAATATSEPSELVTARTADAPRNTPTPAHAKGRDNHARARFTLAASVALMLGTGWFLSNGFQPGERPNGGNAPASNGFKLLPGSDAGGNNHLPLKKIEEDKTKGDNGDKIDTSKIGD